MKSLLIFFLFLSFFRKKKKETKKKKERKRGGVARSRLRLAALAVVAALFLRAVCLPVAPVPVRPRPWRASRACCGGFAAAALLAWPLLPGAAVLLALWSARCAAGLWGLVSVYLLLFLMIFIEK